MNTTPPLEAAHSSPDSLTPATPRRPFLPGPPPPLAASPNRGRRDGATPPPPPTPIRLAAALVLVLAFAAAPAPRGVGVAAAARGGWVTGTYTTTYWDCCKPSCSWPGKGTLGKPVRSCHADGSTAGVNERSACEAGGTAGACVDNTPWQVSAKLSYGFAAAAVSGSSGLTGDDNCGQCYAIRFRTGHTHVIQVTNIGYDVRGDHSFDLMVPGGGRGIFKDGCDTLHGRGTNADCGRLYGGCQSRSACRQLAPYFRRGCRWRYSWLGEASRSGNPRVRFRRVRCPKALVARSRTVAADDRSQRRV